MGAKHSAIGQKYAIEKMSHCIGVRSKREGGGAYLTFVNISNINIGDNIENNIGDNVVDIGVLSAGEGGGGEGRCRLAPLAG